MQTERVTFLTSPDHKAALETFAANNGMSTGRVVREATTRYIAEGAEEDGDEAELAALVRELNAAVPQMRADIADAVTSMKRANEAVDAVLAGETARR